MRKAIPGEEIRQGKAAAAVSAAFAALWFGVFPLACDFTYSNMTQSKWFAALFGTVITVALTGIALCSERPRKRGKVWMLLGILLGLMAASALYWTVRGLNAGQEDWSAVIIGARYEGLFSWVLYGTVLVCLSLYPPSLEWASRASALSLTAQLVIIALQYQVQNPLGLFPGKLSILTNYEFQGTIGNIDMLAGVLALQVPLCLLPWLLDGKKAGIPALVPGLGGVLLCLCTEVQAGYLALGMLALGILYLMLTRHRTRARGMILLALLLLCALLRQCIRLPWLGETEVPRAVLAPPEGKKTWILAAGIAVCCMGIWPVGRFLRRDMPKKWALAGIALLMAAAVALIALLPVPEGAGGLWELHEMLNGRAQASFGSERIGIWQAALGLTGENPILGIGSGNFRARAAEWLAAHGVSLWQTFDNPHNMPLDVSANFGIPALLAWLALLGCLILCARKDREAGDALILTLLCWLVQGMFTFSICIVSPMAWAVMGMMAGSREREAGKEIP